MARAVVAGGSGFIGRVLVASLKQTGTEVRRLVRHLARGPDEITWDPQGGVLDPRALEGVDAVVNLTGRRIAPGRWTAKARREIVESRVLTGRLLVETLGKMAPEMRPPVFISASAIGVYGDRGDETLTEASPPGRGFMVEVVQAWEREALRAPDGVRVVCTRFGLIVSQTGGFLAPLLPIFRLGLGGPLGSGRQWWSWVHLDDVIAVIQFAMRTRTLEGPVNVISPQPVTNREFTRTLAGVLRRPAVFPAPALALRLVLGRQEADELILSSQRVVPARLREHDFAFRWTDLQSALEDVVGRAPTRPR